MKLSLKDFMQSSQRNAWINEPNLKAYMRKGRRFNKHRILVDTLEIANVVVHPLNFRRKGRFKKFLKRVEYYAKKTNRMIFIENCLDLQFVNHFRKRPTYHQYRQNVIPSFYKEFK